MEDRGSELKTIELVMVLGTRRTTQGLGGKALGRKRHNREDSKGEVAHFYGSISETCLYRRCRLFAL